MRTPFVPAVAVSACLSVACSSGGGSGGPISSGSGSVTGTFRGSAVNVRSAITAPFSVGNGQTVQAIILADASNACVTVTAGKQPGSTQSLIFEIANANLQTGSVSAPTAPGTFYLFSPSVAPTSSTLAKFAYQKTDATCATVAAAVSTSGSVVISAVSGGSFTGTSTLTTTSGDAISATFSAASCPALGPLLSSPSPPPCQ